MKIAFLLPKPYISGGVFVCFRHAHYMAARGHDVTMAFVAADDLGGIAGYPCFSLRVRSLADLDASGEQFDAVISGWWECYFHMFRIAADRYVHFVQGDDRDSLREQMGGSFVDEPLVNMAFSDPRVGYLTVARWLKERLEAESSVAAEYAPNGVDLGLFNPEAKPLVPRGQRPRILIEGAGHLTFKRVDLAFSVASQVPGAEAWHVSSDGFRKSAWKARRRFDRVPLSGMPAIYRSCDLLLKLSVVEGFFGPPLEMMACGGTAVVTRVNGHDEYVVDGHNALTVPLDDEAAAVDAVKRLVNDAGLRRELSAHGLATAREMGWDRQCPKFEAGLTRLLDRLPAWTPGDRAAQLPLAELQRRISRPGETSGRAMRIVPRPILRLIAGRPALASLASRALRGVHRRCTALRVAAAPGSGSPIVGLGPIARTCRRTPEPVGTPLAPIAFVGQPEYFRAAYFDGLRRMGNVEFPISSADPADRLRGLPDFVAKHGVRSCIVFRPEWLASVPGLVERLQAAGVRVIGYSTEPIPTEASGKWHPDQATRLMSLRRALSLPLDLLVHYDRESEGLLRAHGVERLMCHPLPVSEALFFPEDCVLEFDACFLGRSTPHRERLLGMLKSKASIIHVAHGLVDEHARTLMNRSRVVLNIHCEDYPNFETRVVQALRCGRPVVSEPLSGSLLNAGVDYHVASTPKQFLDAVEGLAGPAGSSPAAAARADLRAFSIDALLARIAAELRCEVDAAAPAEAPGLATIALSPEASDTRTTRSPRRTAS